MKASKKEVEKVFTRHFPSIYLKSTDTIVGIRIYKPIACNYGFDFMDIEAYVYNNRGGYVLEYSKNLSDDFSDNRIKVSPCTDKSVPIDLLTEGVLDNLSSICTEFYEAERNQHSTPEYWGITE